MIDEKLDILAYKIYKKEHNQPNEIYAHIEFFIEHKYKYYKKYYNKLINNLDYKN